jgi:DNA-binding NtrC family response regulator
MLVVDDDVNAGGMLAQVLARKFPAAEVAFAGDLQTINDYTANRTPDILVTDYLMPGINGMQVARLLKQRNPALKVIVLSGLSELETFCYENGTDCLVNHWLAKPVAFDQLFAMVESCLTAVGDS